MERILVLAPHTDDMEFGCGGTIKRLTDEGHKVSVLVFSSCAESLPAGFTVEDIKNEQFSASGLLGVSAERIKIHDFPVRRFDEYRQDILEILVDYKKNNEVTKVFTPSRSDVHQDHAVVCSESIRAFKHFSILGYELPWNDMSSHHNFFYALTRAQIEAKSNAINCFLSQKGRGYTADHMVALAQVRGLQAQTRYAECFETIRWVHQ